MSKNKRTGNRGQGSEPETEDRTGPPALAAARYAPVLAQNPSLNGREQAGSNYFC
jgi:hypothetical protein